MSPNSGDGCPLISKPVPAVMDTKPRVVGGELNVFIGLGKIVALAAAPPPSQLISRRPVGNDIGVLPLFTPPELTSARKRSTTPWIDAASGPEPDRITIGVARARIGMPRRIKVRIVDEMGATGWQVLERIRILRLLTLHGQRSAHPITLEFASLHSC